MKIPLERIEKFVAAAKSEAPVTMKSIWLDVDGKRLLATDGHYAMRVEISVDEEDVSGLLSVEVFELARKELQIITKMQGKEEIPDPWLRVFCGDEIVIIENLLTQTKHLVDRPELEAGEPFPNVDAIFPVLTTPPTASLNLEMLVSVAKNIDPQNKYASFFISDPEKVIVVATGTGKGSVALMPSIGAEEGFYKSVNARALPKAAE
jgi:hypothetical protein